MGDVPAPAEPGEQKENRGQDNDQEVQRISDEVFVNVIGTDLKMFARCNKAIVTWVKTETPA